MDLRHEVLANAINSTPPPAHMTDPRGARHADGFSLKRLEEACKRRGVDLHEAFARSMDEEVLRRIEASDMTELQKIELLLKQAALAWKAIDKAVPTQQAVKHSGDPEAPFVIQYSDDERRL